MVVVVMVIKMLLFTSFYCVGNVYNSVQWQAETKGLSRLGLFLCLCYHFIWTLPVEADVLPLIVSLT